MGPMALLSEAAFAQVSKFHELGRALSTTVVMHDNETERAMLFASYQYPILDFFLTMLDFFLFIIWIWLLIIIFSTSSAATTWAGGPRPCGSSS